MLKSSNLIGFYTLFCTISPFHHEALIHIAHCASYRKVMLFKVALLLSS